MDTYICGMCGYLAFNQAPDKCPACGAPKTAFKNDPTAIKKPADPANLNDLEKKHIPLININKQCGLVGPGCADANIKIGAMLHVMEEKHYILYIDLYLDYNFIGRYLMTPASLNPVLGAHLKAASGKLTVLENCNIHGRWISEVAL